MEPCQNSLLTSNMKLFIVPKFEYQPKGDDLGHSASLVVLKSNEFCWKFCPTTLMIPKNAILDTGIVSA